MASRGNSSALRALAVEYKSLQEEPVEGFCVKLVNDENLFEWEVAIFGPPDTLYMGGCFKVKFTITADLSKRAAGALTARTPFAKPQRNNKNVLFLLLTAV